jgi:hypothetical protein
MWQVRNTAVNTGREVATSFVARGAVANHLHGCVDEPVMEE